MTPVSVAPLEQRPLVTFMGFLLAAPHGCAATVAIATAVVGSTRSFLELCATTLAPLKRGALGAGSTEQVLETLFSYVMHEGLHMHVLHNAFMTLCTFAPHTHSTSPLHETIVACLTAAQAAVVHAPRAGGLGADGEAEPDPRDVVLGKPLTALVEQVAGLARLVVQLSDVLVQGRQLQAAQGEVCTVAHMSTLCYTGLGQTVVIEVLNACTSTMGIAHVLALRSMAQSSTTIPHAHTKPALLTVLYLPAPPQQQ